MPKYILHVESGLRLELCGYEFDRQCKAIAIMMHEQKGHNAAHSTYTFKLMKTDEKSGNPEYEGMSIQYLVKPITSLMAVPVPRGEGE